MISGPISGGPVPKCSHLGRPNRGGTAGAGAGRPGAGGGRFLHGLIVTESAQGPFSAHYSKETPSESDIYIYIYHIHIPYTIYHIRVGPESPKFRNFPNFSHGETFLGFGKNIFLIEKIYF